MTDQEFIPGQFVKIRHRVKSPVGVIERWDFVRWWGVDRGYAVMEDAIGDRFYHPCAEVYALDFEVTAA